MSDPLPTSRTVRPGGPSGLTVLLAGALTTALALGGVWTLARCSGENVMGWYGNYVLPVGPLLVGLVASSGFGIGSYASGTRITGRLLWAMLAVLVAAYALAQWLEYRQAFPGGAVLDDGTELGFWRYFDLTTRSLAFEEQGGEEGHSLGALGYLVRLGDVIGFSAGGLLIPFALRKLPYCAACGVYMRRPVLAYLPADVPRRRIRKKDTAARAAHEAARAEARAGAELHLAELHQVAGQADPARFAAALGEALTRAGRRAAFKLDTRLELRLVHCRRCGTAELRTAVVTGQGKQIRLTPLAVLPLERGAAPRLLEACRRRRAG